jgi:hypothetical protein
MVTRAQIGLLALVLTALAVGCSTGAGDGKVWGSLYLPSCGVVEDDWNMGIDFFAADYFDNTLKIRIQDGGQDQGFSDGVMIMVRDVELFAGAAGQAFDIVVEPDIDDFLEQGPEIGYPETTWDSPARVTLYLNETCPGNTFAFTDGYGSIAFDSIYVPDESKRIAGHFHLWFIDPREWVEPGEVGAQAELFGEFDFNYNRGKPAQTFPK